MSAAVLQLAPSLHPGGIGRDVVDLARHSRARGLRSLVASPGGALERELAAAGGTHLQLVPEDQPLARWRNRRRILRAVRSHDIGLIHAHGPQAGATGAAVARGAGIPLVASMHEATPEPWQRQAKRLIAVSEFVAEAMVERHGPAAECRRIVRRWVDMDEFDAERVRGYRVMALAERWHVADGRRIVLVPPLPPEDRGHLLLLQALARLPRTDCTALLTGEFGSGGGASLAAFIRKAGLGERVRFAGSVDDLPAALSLAEVVVLPATLPDPSGFLAAAAQAMGKPVIVTHRGALAEAVLPAATGWLVPPDDPGELARALELALVMDPAIRARLGARARAFVRDEFGLEPMCDRVLAVYRELLGGALAPTG